jgi:hypothetical protein
VDASFNFTAVASFDTIQFKLEPGIRWLPLAALQLSPMNLMDRK